MNNRILVSLTLSVCVLSTFVCSAQTPNEVSLEKKVAQMLIVGFRGTEISECPEIVNDIKETGIGGVILFEHNIVPPSVGVDSKERLKKLCFDLQSASPDKLIISIDQEGGRVNRLKPKYGFPRSVSAHYLGETNNKDTSKYYYSQMAQVIAEMGLNVNFAPTVDLNINPECPAIGKVDRSYSKSASRVNKHARYLIEAHHKSGVKTALKHFPGHGSSASDSHLGFTDVTHTWSDRELRPYRYFIKRSLCDMVMVSHTFNSAIDPTYPATLSKRTIDSLLRGKLGYEGIVITDDMNMKAVSANYPFEQALALTINAGVDLIILSSNIKGTEIHHASQVVKTIMKLIDNETIPRSRIEESYERITKFKQGLL